MILESCNILETRTKFYQKYLLNWWSEVGVGRESSSAHIVIASQVKKCVENCWIFKWCWELVERHRVTLDQIDFPFKRILIELITVQMLLWSGQTNLWELSTKHKGQNFRGKAYQHFSMWTSLHGGLKRLLHILPKTVSRWGDDMATFDIGPQLLTCPALI